MEYETGNIFRSELGGYRSPKSVKSIGRDLGERIDAQKFRDEAEARQKAIAKVTVEEKGYKAQLTDLGKLSCFIERFDMIKLEDQNLPQVGPFEDPRERTSFKYGYEMGKVLVDNGFSEENYHAFSENYEAKYHKNSSKSK